MNDVTLFAAALEKQSAAERSAFLDEACAGDAAMRQRVEALLHAHEKAGDYLERPAVEQMAEAAPASDATAALNTAGRPDSGEEEDAPLDFLQPSARPGSLGRLGHYEVLEVLGRGGFGIVLRAFDEMLHRVVAVKVMAPQLAATSPARKRFLREARASAAVRHDNVVAIYNVEEQPIPYLVMELIVGETVQQRLDRVGPLDAAEVARIGRQIAEGLAGAHAMGLIHRDIKPSNILLESGADRVKITDFGLARAADDASLTQSGVIAGTPMYMAPEQAKGEQIDHRADLFSLGSVLYVMCSGRPPFRASTTLAVLKRVAEDGPRPIREIIPEVPDWLCAIIAKLHAKEPAERFQTATEVAEILKQRPQPSAIVGPPIVRPDPPVPAAVPSRRGVWSAALAVMAVALTAVAAVFLALQRGDRRDPPADPGVALVKPGEQQPTKLGAEPWQPRPPLTQEELNKLPSPLDGRKRADIPPRLLALAGGGDPDKAPAELVAVLGPGGPFTLPRWAMTHYPDVSPDGKWLAVACGNDVAVFDTATGALRRTLTGATDRLLHPRFTPDGKRIGAGCVNAKAYVWEAASGKLELTLEDHPAYVYMAFSPDGMRMATGCGDGSLFLWDADGKNKMPLAKQPGSIDALAFSADSKTLASAGGEGVVVLWDTATGNEVRSLKGHTGRIYHLRYSPDGKTLASGGTTETIVWGPETGKLRHTLAASGLGLVSFTADGKILLTARQDEEEGGGYLLTRWDATTGEKKADVPLGPRCPGVGVERFYAASPNGRALYTSHHNGDDRVSVFDAVTGKERFPRADFHKGAVWAVAVSPDGKTLATGGNDHTIRLWDLAAWKPSAVLPPCRVLKGHTNQVWSLAFSPDSQLLVSGGTDGNVILWNAASGKKLRDPFGRIGTWWSRLAISPDGRTVACPQEDGSVTLYEIGSAEQVSWHWHKVRARATAFSPDGKLVASVSHDGSVSVAERASGKQIELFEAGSETVNVAFSRNSRTLLATTAGWQLLTWDLADVKKSTTLSGHTTTVHGLALHPAGRLAATGSNDGTVRVWDLPTGRSHVFDSGRGSEGWFDSVAFTPEGRYLVAGSAAGLVCIWKTPEFPAMKQGAPAAGAIDLLKLVDPQKDTVKGTWTRQKTDLVASGGEAVLELPYCPPAEYDLLVELTLGPQKHKSPYAAGIVFPYAGDRSAGLRWEFDKNGNFRYLLEQKPALVLVGRYPATFRPEARFQLQLHVRRDNVIVTLNGRDAERGPGPTQLRHTVWSADQKVPPGWQALRDNTLLGLRCGTDTTYHRVAVREVSGAGTFTRARAAAPDRKAP